MANIKEKIEFVETGKNKFGNVWAIKINGKIKHKGYDFEFGEKLFERLKVENSKRREKRMTNEQIIKKAIEKAIKNGWRDWAYDEVVIRSDGQFQLQSSEADLEPLRFASINDIIFSHDFAKAIWGEKVIEVEVNCQTDTYQVYEATNVIAWEHHLQHMVLSKEPLEYLEDCV